MALYRFRNLFRFGQGVIAQLVERLNGIEEVWGSNPHGSISHKFSLARGEIRIGLGRV